MVFEVVGDFGGGGAKSERDISRRNAFRGDENVGVDVPVVEGKPFAGAAPAGHDFVGDHEHAVTITDFAQTRKIFRRRHQHSIRSDDGLKDDGGDVALVADHVLDVVSACDVAGGGGVLDGAVVAICFGR